MPMELTYLLAAEQLTVTANPLIPKASWFTNSMLVTVIVTILVVIWARRSTRKMSLIPDGVQNVFEAVVETLYVTFEGIVGKHMIPKVFSLIGTLFIFILTANWFGLVPGVGTIGFGEPGPGLVGLLQAFVFAMLCAVYIKLSTGHEGGEGAH
jgi:F-type H+-transporting ATPase subunit a